MADCSLPGGMWHPGFNLSHKVEFNFDAVEEQVMSNTSEKKMVE